MLTERQIPLEISSLKGSHCRVLIGLFRYADKQGVCWPSLRTLAGAIPMAVRSVRRAIDDMAALGYLTVTKITGSVNRYHIAARFLRAMGYAARPQPVEQLTTQDEVDHRQLSFIFEEGGVRKKGSAVRTVRTESKVIESKESLKKSEAISLGRDAPPEEPQIAAPLSSDQAKELKERKAQKWRDKIVRFVQRRYSGQELEIRLFGLMGEDPITDADRWYEICEKERRAADWDDVRDRRKTQHQAGFRAILGVAAA